MPKMSRRKFVQAGGAAIALAGMSDAVQVRSGPRVVVVGAGAFGGWTALHLLRAGAQVTLVDAWGPGNPRASSGGETRVIRGIYGPGEIYTRMTARARELWKAAQREWKREMFHPAGVLWMAGKDDAYVRESLPHLKKHGFRYHELAVKEAAQQFPQVSFEGIGSVVHELDAGFLMAREACMHVVEQFQREGGKFEVREVSPMKLSRDAEATVFACGPWLGKLFPDVIGERVAPTRQEVLFFGAPAGDERFDVTKLPVWIDTSGAGDAFFYGIPAAVGRGFKLADDTRGPAFDPTTGDRTPSEAAIAKARRYLGIRFPALKDAPLVEARVCQYENSPDGNLILDRHPQMENVWLLGGGSGHGFKMGPAVGELAAQVVLGKRAPEAQFLLSRFAQKTSASTHSSWHDKG